MRRLQKNKAFDIQAPRARCSFKQRLRFVRTRRKECANKETGSSLFFRPFHVKTKEDRMSEYFSMDDRGLDRAYREQVLSEIHDWRPVLDKLGLTSKYRRRSTGTIFMLCYWHGESIPSLEMWPHGHFICHGCGHAGDMTKFVFERLQTGKKSPTKEEVDDFFRDLRGTPDPSRRIHESVLD